MAKKERNILVKSVVAKELKGMGCGMRDHENTMNALGEKVSDMIGDLCKIEKHAGRKRINTETIKALPK